MGEMVEKKARGGWTHGGKGERELEGRSASEYSLHLSQVNSLELACRIQTRDITTALIGLWEGVQNKYFTNTEENTIDL